MLARLASVGLSGGAHLHLRLSELLLLRRDEILNPNPGLGGLGAVAIHPPLLSSSMSRNSQRVCVGRLIRQLILDVLRLCG